MSSVQAKTVNQIKMVEITGKPYDRGQEYGVKVRDSIGRLIDMFFSIYTETYKLSKEQVLRRGSKYIPFIEDYSPEIAEEIKGIAEGSGRELQEVTMLVSYYEIYDRLAFGSACTSFAISGKATADGNTYMGQNWDDDLNWYWNGEMPFLLKVKRDSGPNLLAYTYPGIPAGAGVNSEGIALCWNTMHCEDHKLGVPTYVILTEVLHQKRIGDALGAIIRADRAESFNFVLADGNGEIYDVEATPSDIDIFYSDKYLGHANHFLSTKLSIKKDLIVSFLPDTVVRSNRMNKLLNEKCGSFDLKKATELLKDHTNYPKSICRHPAPGEAFQMVTFDSFVIAPAKKEMWLSHGNPCQNVFDRYTV